MGKTLGIILLVIIALVVIYVAWGLLSKKPADTLTPTQTILNSAQAYIRRTHGGNVNVAPTHPPGEFMHNAEDDVESGNFGG